MAASKTCADCGKAFVDELDWLVELGHIDRCPACADRVRDAADRQWAAYHTARDEWGRRAIRCGYDGSEGPEPALADFGPHK